MIIKHKDSLAGAKQELEGLLKLSLSAKQRFLVERELKIMKAGERGEQDSAYFLDFAYGNSENWALIHDLRIEWQGRVAQIDHLAINRLLEVYVLETKNFFYGMKINDIGEFNIWNGKAYVGIESPIEQNKRHVTVLEERVNARKIAPKRLGIPLPILFKPYVLVSPKSRIIRPEGKTFPTDGIVKADQYKTLMDKRFDEMNPVNVITSISKMVSPQTVEGLAREIASLHRPGSIDFRAKFGIEAEIESDKPKAAVSNAVVSEGYAGICDLCGCGVEKKVVYYCRFNRKKLGGHKVLCQVCQKEV